MVKRDFILVVAGAILCVLWAWIWFVQDRIVQHEFTVQCLDKECIRLTREVSELEHLWSRVQNIRMQQTRTPSRVEVGEKIKDLARNAGLYDMSFQMAALKPSKRGIKKRGRSVVIDFVAEKDTSVAQFIDGLHDVFKGRLVPKSLLLEKGTVAQGDGELGCGLTGCYVLEWPTSGKRPFKGGQKAIGSTR